MALVGNALCSLMLQKQPQVEGSNLDLFRFKAWKPYFLKLMDAILFEHQFLSDHKGLWFWPYKIGHVGSLENLR